MNMRMRWAWVGLVLCGGVAACSSAGEDRSDTPSSRDAVSALATCSHDVECTGGPLTGGAKGTGCTTSSGANGWCVQEVCADIPSCCTSAWTNDCVQDMANYNTAGGFGFDDCPAPSADPAPACSSSGGGGGGDAGTGGGTGDGTPTRKACTGNFGSAMTTSFGRLDGFLVSIIQPGQGSGCNGDAHHVHLQVQVKGSVYDIAVNVDSNQGSPDVDFEKINAPLADGAWSEGWHPGVSFDYVNTLGVHSGDFTTFTPTALANEVTNDLASVNHISVFTTGYGATGGHLIHRNTTNKDGALVLQPLSGNPQYLLFHFDEQTF